MLHQPPTRRHPKHSRPDVHPSGAFCSGVERAREWRIAAWTLAPCAACWPSQQAPFICTAFPPQPSPSYSVLFHVAVGILLTVLLLPLLFRLLASGCSVAALAGSSGCGAVLGVALIFIGISHLKPWLYAHIALCVIGAFSSPPRGSPPRFMEPMRGSGSSDLQVWCSAIAAIGRRSMWSREVAWRNAMNRDPQMPSASMDGEGDGPQGSFSKFRADETLTATSRQVFHAIGRLPALSRRYLQTSGTARPTTSHPQQSVVSQKHRVHARRGGMRASKWCAGCHDPALLFSGLFDKPIKELVTGPKPKLA